MTNGNGHSSNATIADAPVVNRIAHIVIYTNKKYEEMKTWYGTVFNARVVHERGGEISFLTFDSEHHRFAIRYQPQLADRDDSIAGIAHVGFTFDNLGEMFATYERIKTEGIRPASAVNHGMTTSLYYRDPIGNKLELQVENQDNQKDAVAVLEDEERENVLFDPDKMLAAVKAGVPDASLKSQAYILDTMVLARTRGSSQDLEAT
ncbi:MAG: biphenyl 2,3-dioxygenase [Rhodospirillaceae bacterium]|nr:biphenyl 2,3-dioxygenase [Rhodospirillaceae bacterium]MBT5837982.1 biphenyl 2,3-dioxygenase [Rhodospirillaceae bacterium]